MRRTARFTEAQRDPWADCSCGCRWYRKLAGPLGWNWGVCANPRSHRCGLLTFEHQGCLHFEATWKCTRKLFELLMPTAPKIGAVGKVARGVHRSFRPREL